MRLLDFFWKRNKCKSSSSEIPGSTPKQILVENLELVPSIYHSTTQFKFSVECLAKHEYGESLLALIDLADESGHYFSESFWSDMADCAELMGMKDIALHCQQQIERNMVEVGATLRGWTVDKVSINLRHTYVAEKIKEGWLNERRKKDRLPTFISKDGFYFKPDGRAGTIYYVEGGRVLEIDLEMSGVKEYNILLFWDNVEFWALPTKQTFSKEERERIEAKLREWLVTKKLRAEF